MDCVINVPLTEMRFKVGGVAEYLVEQSKKLCKIKELEKLLNTAFHYEPVSVTEIETYLQKNAVFIKTALGIEDVVNAVTEGCHKRWIDKCGNTWDANLYSYKNAMGLSRGLVNCTNCHECISCTNCSCCANCTDCDDCWYCEACSHCSAVQFSSYCINEHSKAFINGEK